MDSSYDTHGADEGHSKLRALMWPAIVVSVGLAIGAYMLYFKPEAKRSQRASTSRLVEVMSLNKIDYQVKVKAMGSIVPSKEISLQPRVSGEVVWISPEFEPGGHFKKDEVILRIDPEDYRLAIEEKLSALALAELNYKLEVGRQDIAKREWEMMNSSKATAQEKELTLRKPHLKQTRAAFDSARAALDKANLDLDRTEIKAPFDCIVRNKQTDLGAQVSSQSVLATLIGGNSFRCLTTIPVDRVDWLTIPHTVNDKGSKATIRMSGTGVNTKNWTGDLIRLRPDLESLGRMAQVLIEIPLDSQKESPLPVGSYVNVTIDGSKLEKVFVIPRKALRDGNRIWLLRELTAEELEKINAEKALANTATEAQDGQKKEEEPVNPNRIEGKLSIINVEPIWKDESQIIIRNGIPENAILVVSDLSTPVPGIDIWAEVSEQTAPEVGKAKE